MNILYIAIKNLKKNISFYILYFVSVTFILTIFFAFMSFSMNKIIMEKISTDNRVETMINTISVLFMAFVIFYMSYSNKFFLRRRSKEFGIYTMLGYRKTEIIRLLSYENILICFLSLLIGVIIGAFTHKGITAGITKLLNLDIDNTAIPLFNFGAIGYTAVFVFLVTAFLLLSNIITINKITLMELVRYEKKPERKIRINMFRALCGIMLLMTGYYLAADIIRGRNSIWYTIGYSPVALLTIILVSTGTILSVFHFLPWVINSFKNNLKYFYSPARIIIIPNFIYRIRTNAKTIILLTFLIAATLAVTGSMALTLYYPIAAVDRIIPSEIEFKIENEKQAENAISIIEKYTDNAIHRLTALVCVPSSSENLPTEYFIGSSEKNKNDSQMSRKPSFECISVSDYLALLYQQGKNKQIDKFLPPDFNECILVKYEPNRDASTEKGRQYILEANEPIILTVKDTTIINPIGFANSMGTLIVPDEIYNDLRLSNLPVKYVMSFNGNDIAGNMDLYMELYRFLDESPYLVSSSERISEIIHLNSSTFLLLGFLVVIFFIASGSILFFNNISAIIETKCDYTILRNIGYNSKQIKKILSKQVFTFFNIPFLLGLLHSIFAILCYKTALMQNIMGNNLNVYLPILFAFTGTFIILVIYYFITVRFCNKIILR